MCAITFVTGLVAESLPWHGVVDFSAVVSFYGGNERDAYERLLNSGVPVVLKFYMNGCGPCKAMAPIYKNVANDFDGRAVFVELETGKYRGLSDMLNIRSVPAVIFFVNGSEVGRVTGYKSHSALTDLVRKYLGL